MSKPSPGLRVVVHLGPEKTGTTALAKYLTQLSAHGQLPKELYFPSGDQWFGRSDRIQKHSVELERMTNSLANVGDIALEDHKVLEAFTLSLRSSGVVNPTVVLIAETTLSNIEPKDLNSLLLRSFDRIDYVVAVRKQETGIRSLMAQRIRDRARPESSLDPRFYLESGSISFDSMDYGRIAEKWHPDDARIHLNFLPYFDSDSATFAFIDRFFLQLGVKRPAVPSGIEGIRIHPTFSKEGMQTLAKIKNRKRVWGWVPTMSRRLDKQFELSWKIFHNSASQGSIEPSGAYYQPWNLNSEDSLWVKQYFANSNDAFLARLDREGFEEEWNVWEQSFRDKNTNEARS